MIIKFSKRNYYELITGLAPIAAGLMLCAAAPVASAQSYQSATLSPQDCFGDITRDSPRDCDSAGL